MDKNRITVEEYIASFSFEMQEKLNIIRELIIKYAPDVVESISYGMPAYKTYKKPLVYFAGYKNHIGFYATPTGHNEFTNRLPKNTHGKSSVQLHNNEDLPIEKITDIIKFRVNENKLKHK